MMEMILQKFKTYDFVVNGVFFVEKQCNKEEE